jgi:hypothetical protein
MGWKPRLENWKGMIFRCLAGRAAGTSPKNQVTSVGFTQWVPLGSQLGRAAVSAVPGTAPPEALSCVDRQGVHYFIGLPLRSMKVYIYMYESRNWSECPPQSLDCFRFFTKAWSNFLFKSTAGQVQKTKSGCVILFF